MKDNDFKKWLRETVPSILASWFFMVAVLVILGVVLMFAGCTRTVYETVEKEVAVHDTLLQTRVKVDSIYQHDSILVMQYLRGDTVFLDKYRERVEYRLRLKTDTVYISKTDTVKVDVVKEVEKKEGAGSRFLRWLARVGAFSLGAAGVLLFLKLRKFFSSLG